MSSEPAMEGLLRELAPQVLGVLVRRHGQFDACEDAVQEALLAATVHWSTQGVPDRPRSWLLTVATRTLIDYWRTDSARRRRETAAALDPTDGFATEPHDAAVGAQDAPVLLFLCCRPALSPSSQLALTLRAVGGLSTAQIAVAFLVPETTMAQRIGRAKQRIRDTGARFVLPPPAERAGRWAWSCMCCTCSSTRATPPVPGRACTGPTSPRRRSASPGCCTALLPGKTEVAGLLALILLTAARRAARTDPDGAIVALADQDRTRWDATGITEGQALLTRTLGSGPIGPYQIQAAIAAIHDEAGTAEQTDWPQILALYDVLAQVAPGPVVTLSRAVAVAMVHGPIAGLALLGTLDADEWMAHTHRLEAVRAHLLEQAGDPQAARESYLRAARMTASLPEQHYLTRRSALLPALPPATDPAGS